MQETGTGQILMRFSKTLMYDYRRTSDEDWVATRESGDTVRLAGVKVEKGLVPDVRGMSSARCNFPARE